MNKPLYSLQTHREMRLNSNRLGIAPRYLRLKQSIACTSVTQVLGGVKKNIDLMQRYLIVFVFLKIVR